MIKNFQIKSYFMILISVLNYKKHKIKKKYKKITELQ